MLVVDIELLRLLYLSYDDPGPNATGNLLVYDIEVNYQTRQRYIISIDLFT